MTAMPTGVWKAGRRHRDGQRSAHFGEAHRLDRWI